MNPNKDNLSELLSRIQVSGSFASADIAGEVLRNVSNIAIHGNVTNSQIGQTLTNSTNMVQQQNKGQLKTLLEDLEKDVQALISQLPEDQKEETATNLEMLVKAATSEKPHRKWYSVSSEGLLESTKYVKNFTGNIAGTLANLGKLLWPVS